MRRWLPGGRGGGRRGSDAEGNALGWVVAASVGAVDRRFYSWCCSDGSGVPWSASGSGPQMGRQWIGRLWNLPGRAAQGRKCTRHAPQRVIHSMAAAGERRWRLCDGGWEQCSMWALHISAFKGCSAALSPQCSSGGCVGWQQRQLTLVLAAPRWLLLTSPPPAPWLSQPVLSPAPPPPDALTPQAAV